MKREKYVNGIFNHRGQGASFVLATFLLTLFTLTLIPTPAWAKLTDITVTHPVTPADSQPAPGSSNNPVLAFQAASTAGANGGGGTPTLDTLNVTVGGTATLTGCTIYDDTGSTNIGQYDGTEQQVATLSGSGPYNFSPAYVLAAQGSTMYFLVTVNVDSGASGGQTITAQIAAGSSGMTITATGVITYDSVNDSVTHNVTLPASDNLDITDGASKPAAGNVEQDENLKVIHQFTMTVNDSSGGGSVDVDQMQVFYSGTAIADVQNLYFYTDLDGNGAINGADASLGTATPGGGNFTLDLSGSPYNVTDAAPANITVVVDVAPAATGGNTISVQLQSGMITTVADTVSCSPCNYSSNNFTVVGNALDNVTEPGDYGGGSIGQGSSDNNILRIELDNSTAQGAVEINTLKVTIDQTGSPAQDTADISAVKFWDDSNKDGTPDSQITDTVTYTDGDKSYEINFTGYSVLAQSTRQIIVTASIASGATVGRTLSFQMAPGNVVAVSPDSIAATGTFASTAFSISATPGNLTVSEAAATTGVNVEQGQNLVTLMRYQLDSDATGDGSVDISRITVDLIGSTSDIENLYFYEDDENDGDPSNDVVIPGTTGSAANEYWVDPTSFTVNNPTPRYVLIAVDIAESAIATNTIAVEIQAGGLTVSPDNMVCSPGCPVTSANFTVIGNALTNVLEPGDYGGGDIPVGSQNNNILRIRLQNSSQGAVGIDTLKVTIDQTPPAAVNGTDISTVKFWNDTNNDGTPDSQITDTVTYTDGDKSYEINFTSYSVPVGDSYIIVTADIAPGATDGNKVSFEMAPGYVVAVSPDSIAATGTFAATPFTITSGPPDKLRVSNITVGPTSIFRGDRNVPLLSFSVITSSGSGGNNSITINEVYLNFYEMGSGVIDNFISANMVKFYDDPDKDGTVNNFKGIFSCDSTTCTLGNLSEVVSNVSSNFYIVTGNTTSTPIYSSFKTGINDGGGFTLAGADTLAANNPSGVTSGNITQDFDRRMGVGWNLITASKADTTVNYSSVFSDDTAPYVPYMIEWSNTNVDSSWDCGTCAWSSTVQNNTMSYGKGYFFFAEEDGQILSTNGGSYATLQHSVSLTKGANIVGNPFNYILPMDATWPATGVYIDNGSTQESLKQAATNGWIEADLFWYNGNTYEAVNVDSAVDPYNYMVPWRGYWIRITDTTGSYSIIFKP